MWSAALLKRAEKCFRKWNARWGPTCICKEEVFAASQARLNVKLIRSCCEFKERRSSRMRHPYERLDRIILNLKRLCGQFDRTADKRSGVTASFEPVFPVVVEKWLQRYIRRPSRENTFIGRLPYICDHLFSVWRRLPRHRNVKCAAAPHAPTSQLNVESQLALWPRCDPELVMSSTRSRRAFHNALTSDFSCNRSSSLSLSPTSTSALPLQPGSERRNVDSQSFRFRMGSPLLAGIQTWWDQLKLFELGSPFTSVCWFLQLR